VLLLPLLLLLGKNHNNNMDSDGVISVQLRNDKGKSIQNSGIIQPTSERVSQPSTSPLFLSKKTTTEGPKVIGGASRGLGGRLVTLNKRRTFV